MSILTRDCYWGSTPERRPTLVPPCRELAAFNFVGVPSKPSDWWLVLTPDAVDVCNFEPGCEFAVSVTASLRRMVVIWPGDLGWPETRRSGGRDAARRDAFRRALSTWLPTPRFAAVPCRAAAAAVSG